MVGLVEKSMNTYSQAGQDMYAFGRIRKRVGTFLDIGCGHPKEISNTLALEEMGWRGVLLDITERPGIRERRSKFVCADATKVHWPDHLSGFLSTFDYLSLDVDSASYDALVNIMRHGYKFRVITIEHDAYRFGDEPRRKMRELLTGLGYTMDKADVCGTPDMPFEDWWIHPEYLAELPKIVKSGSHINRYFDAVFCINMARRPDRWAHAVEQSHKFDLQFERFEAIDMGHMANDGCTQSHRAVMGMIVDRNIERALVLEDDFEFIYPDSQEMFAQMIKEVPTDWDMLYLGGHYAEPPRKRISKHVILMGHMKTTSSYGVTQEMAQRIYKHIEPHHGGAIDELYRVFHQQDNCYIFQPRICVQYANFSDIQGLPCGHAGPMMDTRHEQMV